VYALRVVPLAILTVVVVGCNERLATSRPPADPPPFPEGVQAYVQIDDDRARPGDRVRVFVKVRFGAEHGARLGSYTGRLRFDPRALRWHDHAPIRDGLRAVNPSGAAAGEIRFAGASAGGFEEPVLYVGEFEVLRRNYVRGLRLEVEELAAALSLADLRPDLEVAPRVFVRPPAD
jgi:hypothetical protein